MSSDQRLVVGARPTAAMVRKLCRFLLVGGLCTGLQYLMLAAFVEGFGWPPTPASTVGYGVSSAVNYLLNYTFTFESAAGHGHSVPRFLLVSGCGVILNGTVTFIGTTIYGAHYLIAQAAATCVTLLWNFLANLRWTF